ncbi:MAG: CAP domain-containing protein [Gemmatimonadota bacterium]|nr:CAP domain-containing protein [Gemmatimonadota bacterium]
MNYTGVEREIIHLVNIERIKIRLDTLIWNPALDKAAKIQAVEMAAQRKMAHELPGARYPTLRDRISSTGYGYRHLTENIAYGFPGASGAVSGWMASPGHRANILDRVSVETGVGVARAKTGELYYCQLFGARLY